MGLPPTAMECSISTRTGQSSASGRDACIESERMMTSGIFSDCATLDTVRPHLPVPQMSSSLTFCSSLYWNKSAIILLYTMLLLPHLSSFLILSQYRPEHICAYTLGQHNTDRMMDFQVLDTPGFCS